MTCSRNFTFNQYRIQFSNLILSWNIGFLSWHINEMHFVVFVVLLNDFSFEIESFWLEMRESLCTIDGVAFRFTWGDIIETLLWRYYNFESIGSSMKGRSENYSIWFGTSPNPLTHSTATLAMIYIIDLFEFRSKISSSKKFVLELLKAIWYIRVTLINIIFQEYINFWFRTKIDLVF